MILHVIGAVLFAVTPFTAAWIDPVIWFLAVAAPPLAVAESAAPAGRGLLGASYRWPWDPSLYLFILLPLSLLQSWGGPGQILPALFAEAGLLLALRGLVPWFGLRLRLWVKLAILAALVVVPLAVYWISTTVP